MLSLDVGIGSEPYHKRNWFNMKGEVIGIDIKKNHKPEVLCDAQNLPFQNEIFDNLTCSEVLEHLPNPSQALKEFHRVLKPNGLLYITVPNGAWLAGTLQLMLKKENVSINPEHINGWDCAHLKQLLEQSKFKVLKISFFTRDSGSRRGISERIIVKLGIVCPQVMHGNIMVIAKRKTTNRR